MRLDYEQYKMVKEALHERANLLEIAPHLSFPLPIMLPVYRWWQVAFVRNNRIRRLLPSGGFGSGILARKDPDPTGNI